MQPELAPALNPEVVLGTEPPKPEQQEIPQESQLPAPETTAPQVPQVRGLADVAAAPMQGAAQRAIERDPDLAQQVVALLERNKRYPAAAQARNDRGTAQVAFSLDRRAA